MEGTIVSFRRGRKTQHRYQMIVNVSDVDSKEKAKILIDKNIIWKSPAGKEIKGRVSNTHGNKGCLRAQFEKGLPGQSIGTQVKIED